MKKEIINTLSINERVIKSVTKNNQKNSDYLFNRKHLLSDLDKKKMIDIYYGGINKFLNGISSINKHSNVCSDDFPWFLSFKKQLHNIKKCSYTSEELGTSFAARFLIPEMEIYLKELFSENNYFLFSENFFKDCITTYLEELSSILNKTIIQDLHNYKKHTHLEGEDGQKRFKDYLNRRFGDEESLEKFFLEYPVLIRIIWLRTNFFKKNIENILTRMDNNFLNFVKELGLTSNKVSQINIGAGDTHNKGQSVAIIKFEDGLSIVYKPKNLEIVNSLDKLMNEFNRILGNHFYIPKRLIKPDYTFEEFIEQKPLDSNSQGSEYYYNYGMLLGFSYILKGTDLHYENIVAYKKYPVLIDLETFLQQSVPLNRDKYGVTSKLNNEIMESVLGSCMLPLKLFRERTDDRLKGIDYSGLSMGDQESPFNVLQLINIGTDSMKYQYKGFKLTPKENIPTYRGVRLSFSEYKSDIYSGFSDFMRAMIKNRDRLSYLLDEWLNNKYVRSIMRPTQQYADLLGYSYHPNCMTDYIEREKVVQNLWSYSFKNKDIIKNEMNEILEGDIPQFFINTSETNLYSSDFDLIPNVFEDSSLNIVKKRLLNVDESEIEKQLKIIQVSLQNFSINTYIENESFIDTKQHDDIEIKNTINDIAKNIIKQSTIDEKTNTMNFIDIIESNDLEISPLNENLYDGLSGVYLFFIVVDYINGNEKYGKYRKYLKNTILNDSKINILSSFFGKGSVIYPLLVENYLLKSKDSLNLAIKITNELLPLPKSKSFDWIYGNVNMCPILYHLYKITKNPRYLKEAQNILNNVDLNQDSLRLNGFAHGKSNIYYIMNLLNDKDLKLKEEIVKEEDYYKFDSLWKSSKDNDEYTSGWCKGDLGIEISRLRSSDKYNVDIASKYEKSSSIKSNNTLCHGNGALLELMIQLEYKGYNFKKLGNKILNNINYNYKHYNRYNVHLGFSGEKIGLFTGIAGVGYQLARYLDNKVPNVLLLEVGSDLYH